MANRDRKSNTNKYKNTNTPSCNERSAAMNYIYIYSSLILTCMWNVKRVSKERKGRGDITIDMNCRSMLCAILRRSWVYGYLLLLYKMVLSTGSICLHSQVTLAHAGNSLCPRAITSDLCWVMAKESLHNKVDLWLRSMIGSKLVQGFGHYHEYARLDTRVECCHKGSTCAIMLGGTDEKV